MLAAGMLTAALTGCGGSTSNDSISVLTREEGSGTRGAFIELFGIEQKDADGNKVDKTITGAESTNSTSVMLTTVEGNKAAIGYVSLGSLDETKVKALKIDGNTASAENVKSGTYKIARPFNVATKGDPTGVASDFLKFILSEQGQKVVEDNGYISEGNNGSYSASNQTGKITVGGSSSVTPVMEKLKEAYIALNPNVTIDVQQQDSTAGMTGAIDGVYDIGMASRELKDSEKEAGLVPTVIAMDGIAVIVNKDNTVEDLTSEQILKIYTGEITLWSEIE
ncbi:MAG: substrate-binding domain-containing protein [Acutalibacteraceae bacterium]